MMKKTFFKLMAFLLLFGSICVGFVACSSDDDEGISEIIDKSPAQVVDLGLPSGTLWASCNVGATKPEEYGDYFAWGETDTKEKYTWETYKWCNGSETKLIKYNGSSMYGDNGFTDDKTELDLEDDAAYVKWGKNWRMPTTDQMKELRDRCTLTWTNYKGVNGYQVIGPNGNSIFLPAAGSPDSFGNHSAGKYGWYWSRSFYYTLTSWRVFFGSNSYSCDYNERCSGYSVRPVYVKK